MADPLPKVDVSAELERTREAFWKMAEGVTWHRIERQQAAGHAHLWFAAGYRLAQEEAARGS